MRIQSVEVYHAAMPIYPFRTAFSDEDSIEGVLVRMVNVDFFGCGECRAWLAPACSS